MIFIQPFLQLVCKYNEEKKQNPSLARSAKKSNFNEKNKINPEKRLNLIKKETNLVPSVCLFSFIDTILSLYLRLLQWFLYSFFVCFGIHL